MKKITFCISIAIVLLVSLNLSAQEKGYKVVVNAANPLGSLHKADLSDIFLKKTAKFPDGRGAAPVDLMVNSEIRENFSEDIHKKSSEAIESYWAQLLFSGRGVPPARRSETAALQFVKGNPNGIAYVSSSADMDGVKVVKIVD